MVTPFFYLNGEFPLRKIILRVNEISKLSLNCTVSTDLCVLYAPHSLKKKKLLGAIGYRFYFLGFQEHCVVRVSFEQLMSISEIKGLPSSVSRDEVQTVSLDISYPYHYLGSVLCTVFLELGMFQNEHILIGENLPNREEYLIAYDLDITNDYFIPADWCLYPWNDDRIPNEFRVRQI